MNGVGTMVAASQFCIAYVVVDVLCLVLTIIIASNVSRDSGSEIQVRYFFMLLTANLVFVTFDAIWAVSYFGHLRDVNPMLLSIVNGICISSVAFSGYFWLGFTLAYFGSRVTNSMALRIATAIPAALVPVIHVIGYITDQNVIFLADGSVAYGIAHTLNVIVPLAYLLAATAIALHRFQKATTRSQRRVSLVFMLFMVAPAVSGVFDLFVPNMPVAAAGIMISIVFVMMSLQDARISNDALTGLNNRRRAETFLDDKMAHASSGHPLCLLIIDMDRFKAINDTYGHLEGDHALRLMADALRSVCAQVNAFTARWGGDEFVIIRAEAKPSDPDTISRLLRETLDHTVQDSHVRYHLECTVGYAVCDSASETREHLVAAADRMLYENKRPNSR